MTTTEKPRTAIYHSKLVGVTFEGRQDTLAVLRGKEPLRVRREKDNKFDANAVAVDVWLESGVMSAADNADMVDTSEWVPVGYIAKDKNADISAALDAGEKVYIQCGGITGGGSKNYGMNISLEYKLAEKKQEEKVAEKATDAPTKNETVRVLQHLVKALGGEVPAVESNGVIYKSPLTGEEIELQEVNGHKRLEGYLSGSKFPDQFYQEFDKDGMSKQMAEKYGVDVNAILAMWQLNSEVSTGYGTAIHAALENLDRNFELGDKTKSVKVLKTKTNTGPNKVFSKNPFIKKIQEAFLELTAGDYERINELFVWDSGMKLCGSVDRLKIVDRKKKILRVQDFKTDGDIHEKKYQLTTSPFKKTMGNELLDLHWLQLSFYAFILGLKGWKVEGLDIYWLNPQKLADGDAQPWEEFNHDVIDISEVLINGN